MVYTALYRRFRPQKFSDLSGQEHVSRTLKNAIRKGNFVHAYLFCGPRGTGKTSSAKILARAVNCLDPQDGEPCETCAACVRLAAGEGMDVMEIDAASNRGIDEIRELRERVKYAPVQENYKVYIIDEVHMLTGEAFNALLKTLEEPPAHVIFILATTEPHKIPLTVLSRCQGFDFHRIGLDDIVARLRLIADTEQITVDQQALTMIAKKADGGMRDAVNLLDQCAGFASVVDDKVIAEVLGSVDSEFISQMGRSLCTGELATVFSLVEQLVQSGRDLRQFLFDLLDYLRGVLLAKLANSSELPEWACAVKTATLLKAIQALGETDSRLRYSLQPRISLELGLVQACGLPDEGIEAPVKVKPVSTKPTASPKQQAPISGSVPIETAPTAADTPPWEEVPLPEGPPIFVDQVASASEPWVKEETGQKQPVADKRPVDTLPWDVAEPKKVTEPVENEAPPPWPDQAVPEPVAIKPASTDKMASDKLNLDVVREKWPQVLTTVKREHLVTHPFLEQGQPAEITGNRLMIQFPVDCEIHMKTICERPAHRQAVEKALQVVFGEALVISGRLADEPEPDPKVPIDPISQSLF